MKKQSRVRLLLLNVGLISITADLVPHPMKEAYLKCLQVTRVKLEVKTVVDHPYKFNPIDPALHLVAKVHKSL